MESHHETDAHPADYRRPDIIDEPQTPAEESAWRKFLSLYDSLQWHMYL